MEGFFFKYLYFSKVLNRSFIKALVKMRYNS